MFRPLNSKLTKAQKRILKRYNRKSFVPFLVIRSAEAGPKFIKGKVKFNKKEKD